MIFVVCEKEAMRFPTLSPDIAQEVAELWRSQGREVRIEVE